MELTTNIDHYLIAELFNTKQNENIHTRFVLNDSYTKEVTLYCNFYFLFLRLPTVIGIWCVDIYFQSSMSRSHNTCSSELAASQKSSSIPKTSITLSQPCSMKSNEIHALIPETKGCAGEKSR